MKKILMYLLISCFICNYTFASSFELSDAIKTARENIQNENITKQETNNPIKPVKNQEMTNLIGDKNSCKQQESKE